MVTSFEIKGCLSNVRGSEVVVHSFGVDDTLVDRDIIRSYFGVQLFMDVSGGGWAVPIVVHISM